MAAVNPKRAAKEQQVSDVRERFDKAVAMVLVDFRGINVEQVTELRSRFREKGIEYRVVKNNLVMKAIEGSELGGNEAFTAHLKGPTAIAWSYEDPSTAAKIIKDFRKEKDANEKLTVKCGLLEGELFEGERVENELATLPSKDEIRAMLLAQLNAPMQSLVRQLNAPTQNLAYALQAKVTKDEGDEG